MSSDIFYHRGSMGDIIYSLPTILSCGGGGLVLGKDDQYNFLKDLLIIQDYINFVIPLKYWKHWNNITKNLDQFRPIHRKNPTKHLAQCHLDIYKMTYDLSQPWINNIKPKHINKIIINRTPRYHDKQLLDWSLLESYHKDCTFIGLESEYKLFLELYEIPIDYYKCSSGLEMAQIIKGSDLFVGNQSLAFSIAEGLKVNRCLEVYYKMPNCMPQNSNGYVDNQINLQLDTYIKRML
jgi:hypothetical protein